jgi:pimeloyl-ACP methyl ester carboxylesterase
VVLLVHGQPGGGADWSQVADRLAPSYRVIAPDRPGWGASPRPATTIGANADLLHRLCSSLGVLGDSASGPIVVVGHSLGGGIALELAIRHEELVGALVLVSSIGVSEALGGADRLLALPIVGHGLLRGGGVLLRQSARVARTLAGSGRAAGLVNRARRSGALRAVMAEGERPIDGRERRSFLVEQRALMEESPRIEAQLPLLGVPTVVIQGTADHIVPPAAGRRLAATIPGAELVTVRGAGHRVAFERPEVVVDAVERYARLAGLRAAPLPPAPPGA